VEEIQKKIALTTKDFLVSGESFNLVRDDLKGMLITDPQPSPEELPKYYDSEAYISHTDSDKGFMASLYQGVKKYSLALKLRLITSLSKDGKSLLDIGCGTGDFLKLAKANHWHIEGVEPNDKARELAGEKGMVLKESMDELLGREFDVVTLWHVLEHLPNLQETIQTIEAFVKPGGVLIIAVPNFNSFDAKYYKSYWAAYDVPRHLWHFSKKAMQTLFTSEMKLIKIKPMIFDAFYVSLLSEKYKSGNAFSVKALFVGLWSNMAALNSKESSSHIYCFRKSQNSI
jgi:2-polyprenyl-3-methyl-5-hydroxy-6-metoxy-1,4-benzoquinol methylase